LEGIESFKLVLESLKGERRVDLLIVTSLVGRIDGANAAGKTSVGSGVVSS
jgi:hypothetical protein